MYLINKDKYNEVDCSEIPYCYQDNEEGTTAKTFRYCLSCKVQDINYGDLLKSIGNQDMEIEPCVNDEVFFISKDSNIIYHLYDDRGLDVIAKEKDALNSLYTKYSKWILDYDREKIDEVFGKK